MDLEKVLKFLRYNDFKIMYYKHEKFFDTKIFYDDGFYTEIKAIKDDKVFTIKYYQKSYYANHVFMINDKKYVGNKSQAKLIKIIEENY